MSRYNACGNCANGERVSLKKFNGIPTMSMAVRICEFIIFDRKRVLELVENHLRLAHEFGSRFDDSLCLSEIDKALKLIEEMKK